MRYQRVIRHGTSLAVVIPAPMAREINLHRGDAVRLLLLQRTIPGEGAALLYLEIEPVRNDKIQAKMMEDG